MNTEILDKYSASLKMKANHDSWKNEVKEGRYDYPTLKVIGGRINLEYHYSSSSGDMLREDKINKLEFSRDNINKLDIFIKQLIQEEVDTQLQEAKKNFQETLIKQLD